MEKEKEKNDLEFDRLARGKGIISRIISLNTMERSYLR